MTRWGFWSPSLGERRNETSWILGDQMVGSGHQWGFASEFHQGWFLLPAPLVWARGSSGQSNVGRSDGCFFCRESFCLILCWNRSHVDQDRLELLIFLLSLAPKCWDSRYLLLADGMSDLRRYHLLLSPPHNCNLYIQMAECLSACVSSQPTAVTGIGEMQYLKPLKLLGLFKTVAQTNLSSPNQ